MLRHATVYNAVYSTITEIQRVSSTLQLQHSTRQQQQAAQPLCGLTNTAPYNSTAQHCAYSILTTV